MTERAAPIQVRQSDGRLEAFEPDRVCRALFAATEAAGQADAFLARELTDSVVVLLGEDASSPPTGAELVEQIVKFLRELGHPALARCYRDQAAETARVESSPSRRAAPRLWDLLAPLGAPEEIRRRLQEPPLRDLAVSDVFPRDVVSIHRDGLLVLSGLDHPFELSGSVLRSGLDRSQVGQGLAAAVAQARLHSGGYIAIDSPEHALAALDGEPAQLAADWTHEFRDALQSAGLSAVVNLNHAAAPPWAADLGVGPLFADVRRPVDCERVTLVADALRRELSALQPGEQGISLGWHLSGPDLTGEPTPRVIEATRQALSGRAIEFVFDRPRAPVSLGPGLSRRNPAALLAVGIHLPRLAEQVSPRTPEQFVRKLGSLARLARSAGHAKMDFLRRHGRPDVTRGFLLDRARLVVVPVGLDEAVRILIDCPMSDRTKGMDLARQIVQQLREALTSESPHNMDAVLDSAAGPAMGFIRNPLARRDVAGLTAWDADAPPRTQLRSAGALHSGSAAGCAFILVDQTSSAEETALLLKQAWHQTEIHGLRFITV